MPITLILERLLTKKIQYLIIIHLSFIFLPCYLLKLQVTYYKLIMLHKEYLIRHEYEN